MSKANEKVKVSLAFDLIVDLAFALRALPLSKYPGCWEERIDEHWEISANGHKEPQKSCHCITVPPFKVYVQYDGWPFGLISPAGGTMAVGRITNEDAFIEALRRRLEKEKKGND